MTNTSYGGTVAHVHFCFRTGRMLAASQTQGSPMTVMVEVPRAQKTRTDQLSGFDRDRFLQVVRLGRNLDGILKPRMVGTTPMCDWCRKLYHKGRLQAGVGSPHICCGCAQEAERLQTLAANCRHANGRRHLPVTTVPGRDDAAAGRKARF